MRYLYDFEDTMRINGYEKVSDRLLASGIHGSIIFVISNTNSFSKAYKLIKKALEFKCETRTVFIGEIESEYKQLCMLMMTYRNYNVYNVDDISEIDKEYLDAICERECTADEIETFFGPEMAAYPEMREILLHIADSINAGDIDGLLSYLSINADKLGSMAGLIEFMQEIIDRLSLIGCVDTRVDDTEIKKQVDKLRGELSKAKADSDMLNRQLFSKNSEIEKKDNEIEQLKDKLTEYEGSMGASKIVDTYTTASLDVFVNTSSASVKTPKVKEVIYFKEVNPCRFVNTFITIFHTVMSVINGVNTKLLIYDKKEFNNIKYKPLRVVDLETYIAEKDTTLSKVDRLVVVEPSRIILEDALMEKECVIIYDRLGKDEDIVSGRHVHKYYVVNGVKDIHALESVMKIDKSKIVTNVGVSKQCLSIKEIRDFKSLSVNGKVSSYLNMFNIGDDTRTVYDIIIENTGLNKIIRR